MVHANHLRVRGYKPPAREGQDRQGSVGAKGRYRNSSCILAGAAELFSLQRLAGNRAVGRLVANRQPAENAAVFTVQRHHKAGLDDEDVDEGIVYAVFERSSGGVVYVGQTCGQVGIEKRFKQHCYQKGWSPATHYIQQEYKGDVTRLELTALEQAHLDGYAGLLWNTYNAITKAKFNQYKTDKTWRPEIRRLLPRNWEPAN